MNVNMFEFTLNRNTYQMANTVTIDSEIYEYDELINCGGNGYVANFISLSNGQEYALKIIPILRNTSEQSRIETELEVFQGVQDEHIIKYVGSAEIEIHRIQRHRQQKKETTIKAQLILMEKADTDLRTYISTNVVEYDIYSGQILGLANALEILHKKSIHRDLKPENILVVGNKWVISDFGLCSKVDGSSPDITPNDRAIGPKYWLSPEAYSRHIGIPEHKKKIHFYSDIYQMCAIFWFIINRKHPSGILTHDDFIGPENLYAPIIKGLQHNIERRYSSTNEFAHEFRRAILQI